MAFLLPFIPGMDIFEILIFMIEWMPYFFTINVIVFLALKGKARYYSLLTLPTVVGVMITGVFLGSHEDAARRGYDTSLGSMRSAVEHYIETGEGDLQKDILESNKYAPTFGYYEMRYMLTDLLSHTFLHLDSHNTGNIKEGYNKGNAWFEATLGKPMVYTSGIYKTGNENLVEAQNYKLDYVADAIELKKGEKVLDIGCGWGRLIKHFAENYGADMTGITLSSDQRAWGLDLNKDNKPGSGSHKILLQDAMKMSERSDLPEGGYDKITSLEMAEHVGIKRYNEFLTSVHDLLKDDGVFYFQVAGLRRAWRYEDLVWGLFMGEHVFPGADASCPMGWVTTQLERAGFEVQRVSNLGSHYSRTLAQWLEVWRSRKDSLSKQYGAKAWRRWEAFLAWSVRVARQGSSTVFMITATKAGQEKRRIQTQQHIVPTF